METKDTKVTLTSEELRIILNAASIWFDITDNQVTAKRGLAILDKIREITDNDNKTFDLIAR